MSRRGAISAASRWATTLLVLGAWFLLSNHCVLAATQTSPAPAVEGDSCPLHSKKKPAAKIPCCKELRAVPGKILNASTAVPQSAGLRDYASEVFARPWPTTIEIEALDTGPPNCFSFAESVLQESMFSHAPPLS